MKSGIDYFPLDVTLDTKFELIEAEFGLTGFGVVVKLLQKIYGEHGYYIEWTNEVALLFAKRVGLGGSAVSEIVKASIRRGIFDKEMYEKYNILTSVGIQKRYFEAVRRRKSLEIESAYLLVDVAQICKNVDIKLKNVNIKGENVAISKQSRVEKSRVEYSRVEDSRVEKSNCFAHYQKHINPMPSPAVYQFLNSFLDDGMEDEAIIAILDYCRDEGKTSWSYIKAVIQALYEEGVRTLEDYKRSRAEYMQRKKSDKPKQQQKLSTKFSNFQQRKTSYSDIEDAYFESMRASINDDDG